MRENQPIGIFDKIQKICEQVEDRITIDFLKFKDSELYDNEQFPLNVYLDMMILIVERDIIAWVIPDFIYNEVAVYEVVNYYSRIISCGLLCRYCFSADSNS